MSVAFLGSVQSPLPFRFLSHEMRALVHARRTKVVLGFVAWAVIAFPFTMHRPPASLVHLAAQWFGERDAGLKLFLFAYTDLAMNKLAVFSGVVLAGGIVGDERARGELPLFPSKPASRTRDFLVKFLAAVLVFVGMYALVRLVGAIYYPT